jgi:hypothetical protein
MVCKAFRTCRFSKDKKRSDGETNTEPTEKREEKKEAKEQREEKHKRSEKMRKKRKRSEKRREAIETNAPEQIS